MQNHNFIQFLKYAIIGISTLLLYIGILWIFMHYSHLQNKYCNVSAYILATVYNYFLNFYWIFASKASHKKTLLKYSMIISSGIFANSAFVSIVTYHGFNVEISAILVSFIWPFVSFLSMKLWAFKNLPKYHI